MPSSRAVFALPPLLAATLSASAGAAPPAAPREEFAEVCRRLKASDMPWYGEKPALELERALAGFSGGPEEEVRLRAQLGIEYLELGRPAEAVAELKRGLTIADRNRSGDPRRWGMVWYLGLAYLQAAEDQNCIDRHTEASCILPIRPEGVHGRPEAARLAGDAFLEVLGNEPRHVLAAWLLNLARQLSGDFPQGVPEAARLPAAALALEAELPRWTDRAPDLGVNAFDLAGGAIMDDFDGDGLLDLVSSTWDPCGPAKAFRNDGRGGFERATEAWGLDEQLGGLNLVHADYDNDGDLDLTIARGGWMLDWGTIRRSLLRNDLDTPARRFTDVTHAAGLAEATYPSQTVVWADYDGDGDLDLYSANEAASGYRTFPSQLFRNQGDGTFKDVAPEAGVANNLHAKGAAWGDYDDDGDPDLYVSNIGPNRLYRNDGEGRFIDVAPELGVTRPEQRSFATWFFDFDNDGDLDLLVADYETPAPAVAASYFGLPTEWGQPLLYRNDGGRFTEVSRQVGLTRPALPMGSNFGDLDNDGWLDLYLGTGNPGYETLMPNLAFRNLGGRFQEVTFATGLGHLQKGHGVAFGDLDQDGDQDLFHQLGGFFPGDAFGNALFENPGPARSWVTLRLEGTKANRFGVGARIEVKVREGETRRSIHLLAGNGGSFGGSSLQQEAGLGGATAIDEIVVRWPGSGTVDRVRDVAPNRYYRLVEGSGTLASIGTTPFRLGGDAAGKPASGHPHQHGGEPPAPAASAPGRGTSERQPSAASRRGAERRLAYEPGRLRFAADTAGRIEASLYSLSSTFFEAADVEPFLAAVRRHDPRRTLLALVDPVLATALAGRREELRLHLLPTSGRAYSPWPRDPMSLVRGPAGVELLARPNLQPGREEDALLAAELIDTLPEELDRAWGGLRWRVAPVPFHNGQVLLSPEAAWVSLHTLEVRILKLLGLARVPVASFATAEGIARYLDAGRTAAEELARLYGRPVRFVHPLPEDPAATAAAEMLATVGGGAGFDLDSLLTLLPAHEGRPQALVGDLSAGLDLVGRLSPEDWQSLRSEYGLGSAATALPEALRAAQQSPRAQGLDGFLDLVAGHLAQEGWEVRRLPLLLVPTALLAEPGDLRHPDFLLTWNNVVVERRDTRTSAEGFASLLPTADAEARRVFAEAGSALALFPPLVRSIVLGGGYRCASNHLRSE
jgi:hypothetical protein